MFSESVVIVAFSHVVVRIYVAAAVAGRGDYKIRATARPRNIAGPFAIKSPRLPIAARRKNASTSVVLGGAGAAPLGG
jgi:hypothetical protein